MFLNIFAFFFLLLWVGFPPPLCFFLNSLTGISESYWFCMLLLLKQIIFLSWALVSSSVRWRSSKLIYIKLLAQHGAHSQQSKILTIVVICNNGDDSIYHTGMLWGLKMIHECVWLIVWRYTKVCIINSSKIWYYKEW